jgi:hypothetical protein
MDLGRFHHAVYVLSLDYKKSATKKLLQGLVDSLNQLAGNPGEPTLANNFKTKLNELNETLEHSPLNDVHQTLKDIFRQIEAENYFGEALFARVKQAINDNQLTPNLAAGAISKIQADVDNFYANVALIDSGFSKLNVEYDEIDPGECEIGLVLPVERSTKTLKELSKEANKWHNALSAFSEIFDPKNEPITVRTLSTGSWLFYLTSTASVLLGISLCLKNLNFLLKELIRTKELIKQLLSTGINPAALEAVEKDIENKLENGIREIAHTTIKENYKGDVERGNELETQLSQGLKFIASQLSVGAKIELRISPPEKPAETEGEELTQEEKLQIQEAEKFESISNEIQANMDQISFSPEDLAPLGLLNAPDDDHQK